MDRFALLELIDILRKESLPKDWSNQRKSGERKRGWSRTSFDALLLEEKPKIETAAFLKTAYIYQRHNENEKRERQIDPEKVAMFLSFLFEDIPTPSGWPNVIQTFKQFNCGMFYDLVRGYEANFNEEYRITRSQREKAGATEGEDAHTQLLQLAIKAKATQDAMQEKLNKHIEIEQTLKESLKIKDDQMTHILQRIAVLESLLSTKGGDQGAILKELIEIKRTVG
jgi:hypothetical protein